MKHIAQATLCLVLVYGCNGCGSGAATASVEPLGAAAASPSSQAERGPGVSAPGLQSSTEMAEAQNRFAIDLYHQLRNDNGNLAMSPASISLALGMTMAGARGQTAEVMTRTLHLSGIDDPHSAYASQLARWNDPNRTTYELRVANRLFGERTLRFRSEFARLTGDRYGAPLEPIDFASSPEPARARINGWVEEQTNDQIRQLLPEGSISSATQLLLTNAVYFKGRWAREFDQEATRPREFTRADGAKVNVPTMHQLGTFAYAALEEVQLIELPYVGDELSMVVILPTDANGLAAIEQQLSAEQLAGWMSAMSQDDVDVALPRFKIDPPMSIGLRSTLSALGMELPFTGGADFSGMSDASLSISDVFHKAMVEVNEQGTVAAAATAVSMQESAGPVFQALHPFLFIIRDATDGSILFMGRVSDPRA